MDLKRCRKSFHSIDEAKAYERMILVEYAHKKPRPTTNRYVGHLLKAYLEAHPRAAIVERKRVFVSFCEHFVHYPVDKITRDSMTFWFGKIKTQWDYCEKTLAKTKSAVNLFFSWLLDNEIIVTNPIERIKFRQTLPPRKDRVVMSREEVWTILDEVRAFSPDVLYPYIMCLVHTGCRRSEILNLKWQDVDFGIGFAHIKHTKNGTNRQIRMAPSLGQMLFELPRTCEHVCTNKKGTRLTKSRVDALLTRFKKGSSIKKAWTAHAIRHSFAYNFLKAGGKVYQLQAILGHKTIGLTVDLYGQLKACDIDHPSPFCKISLGKV